MKPGIGAAYLEFANRLLEYRKDSACQAFDLAETNGADKDKCAAGRWTCHMLAGNFEAAWRESDAIRRRGAPDVYRMWNGEPVAGRNVILRCLHGLGDAIQFLRYAPRLRSIASSLVVEVPPSLLSLAPFLDGVDHAITWGKGSPVSPPAWDCQVEVTELPYMFRTEMEELPLLENYVRPPAAACLRAGDVMRRSNLPRVGVVWAAGEWNRARSIPFPIFSTLLHESGCEYWNIQGGSEHGEWNEEEFSSETRDISEIGAGVMNLACAIHELDLVITVDTLAAHLAGAMGVQTWVLLQFAADWRWLGSGDTSPWYPSLRLFRQPSHGAWCEVIQQVREELRSWIRGTARTQRIA